jgi:DNA mismatch repair ATPase MutL
MCIPRKAEVRFYQERAIYGIVTQAVESALREFPTTYFSGATDWSFDQSPISNLSPTNRARITSRVRGARSDKFIIRTFSHRHPTEW